MELGFAPDIKKSMSRAHQTARLSLYSTNVLLNSQFATIAGSDIAFRSEIQAIGCDYPINGDGNGESARKSGPTTQASPSMSRRTAHWQEPPGAY